MTKSHAQRISKRSLAVYVVLVAATLIAWSVGIDHGMDYRISTVVVLLVTFVKVYLVGQNFMELREATLLLRGLFSGICVALCVVLVAMYLVTG